MFSNIEKIWKTSAGLEAVVLITIVVGHRCGYVRVPKGHKYEGLDYDDLYEKVGDRISVHGGLTYSAESKDFYSMPSKDNGTWFGFDCGHWGDASDWEAIKALCETPEERVKVKKRMGFMSTMSIGEVRDLDYVVAECELLASQLNSRKD